MAGVVADGNECVEPKTASALDDLCYATYRDKTIDNLRLTFDSLL
jgi:hypothetical protein